MGSLSSLKLPDANEVLVSYSGGSDSLVVLDLCVRAGKRVTAAFWYFLPGLDYTDYWCEYAERRWKVKVLRYQHFFQAELLREGRYRASPDLSVPALNLGDLEFAAREDSGAEWIGYGYKRRDSLEAQRDARDVAGRDGSEVEAVRAAQGMDPG